MKKIEFTPQEDVEVFLDDPLNISFFNEISEGGRHFGVFEPLEFFNILFEQCAIIEANQDKPLTVVNHLKNLDLDKYSLYYLFACIIERLDTPFQTQGRDYIKPLNGYLLWVSKNCISFIRKEFIKLEQELFPETDLKPKKEKNEEIQLNAQQLFEGYTNSQLVLIFYYFFKQYGLEPRRNIDISPMAKFIHLITGKEFKAITSSDFYKKLNKVQNFNIRVYLTIKKPFMHYDH